MVFYNNPSEVQEKYQEYVRALEEERQKILVFERELPLCLELISQAIERCKYQMTAGNTDSGSGQSDQTSSECPVLEEFIPMKSTSSTHEDVDDDQLRKQQLSSHKLSKNMCSKDWLAFTQLSIQTPDPSLEETKKVFSLEEKQHECGTFHRFSKKKTSTDTYGEDKGQSNKKERRCWSQELHRKFLNALQHLGGAYVATPKQIREFMKVDGLTNDEIKSHLQKYRLHTRRTSLTNYDTRNPQLVVIGRIWIPPPDYTTNSPTSPLTNEIKNTKALYAPIASLPPSTTTSLYKTKQCEQ